VVLAAVDDVGGLDALGYAPHTAVQSASERVGWHGEQRKFLVGAEQTTPSKLAKYSLIDLF